MEYTIDYGKTTHPFNVGEVEKKHGAKYVGQFCVKVKGGRWSDEMIPIFYVETPEKPEYSNYFGLFVRNGKAYITDGVSAFSEPIVGIVGSTGAVVYSRCRHDFRSLPNDEGSIDGGRDYLRVLGGATGFPEQVLLEIRGDHLEVVEEPSVGFNNLP